MFKYPECLQQCSALEPLAYLLVHPDYNSYLPKAHKSDQSVKMVFVARPARCLIHPSSSTTRAFSTATARSVITPRTSSALRASVTSRPAALASKIASSSSSSSSPLSHTITFGTPASTRLLTTVPVPREKVKVLAVLYDGGQHALDVSQSLSRIPNPEALFSKLYRSPLSRLHLFIGTCGVLPPSQLAFPTLPNFPSFVLCRAGRSPSLDIRKEPLPLLGKLAACGAVLLQL